MLGEMELGVKGIRGKGIYWNYWGFYSEDALEVHLVHHQVRFFYAKVYYVGFH